MYRQGPKVELVPAVPYKLLDIGTQMGEYHIEELIPKKGDKDNILHPRHTRPGIPPNKTFHSIVQKRVGSSYGTIQQWCNENAWFNSSPECDFLGCIDGDCQFLSRRVPKDVHARTKIEIR